VLRFNVVVLDVYRVEETIKEEFVANAIQVEMQRCNFYIARHAARAINAVAAYQTKHEIIDTNMI